MFRSPIAKPLAASLLLGLSLAAADAKTGDSDQPVNVAAQHSRVDNKTGNVVYTGNVVITQGSLQIKADTVTLLRNKDGDLNKMIAEGKPAEYHQLTDKNEPVTGTALRIEYDTADEIALFLNNVKLIQQGGDTVNADRVEYHAQTSVANATANDGKRVITVIQPRKKKTDAEATVKP